MLLNGVGRVDRDLVVCLVTLLHAEVVVLKLNVEVGVNQAVFDELPNNPRHFIAIELDNDSVYLDLFHVLIPSPRLCVRTHKVYGKKRMYLYIKIHFCVYLVRLP